MLGAVVGWYARKWWERRQQAHEPPPEKPLGTYEGRLTLNHTVAGPMTTECKISEPDENGQRKLLDPGDPVAQASHWLSTFFGNRDGQLTVRFHRPCDAMDALRSCSVQDEFRIEIYRTKQGKAIVGTMPVATVGGAAYQPFGSGPGEGGIS